MCWGEGYHWRWEEGCGGEEGRLMSLGRSSEEGKVCGREFRYSGGLGRRCGEGPQGGWVR